MSVSPRQRAWIMLASTAAVLIGGYLSVEVAPFSDKLQQRPETDESQKQTLQKLGEQNNQFSQWAFALLAGVIAVIVTTKVRKTSNCAWLYAVLGPAGAALLMSLRAGWQFQRRLTNFAALNNYSDLPNASSLLIIQWRLFMVGLICATIFALWYLYHIVNGEVDPAL